LNNLGLYNNIPNIISCPTCGRLRWDLTKLLEQVKSYCASIKKPMTIAITGWNVNGIGEWERADVGVYGSKDNILVHYHGELIKAMTTKMG
jgi:(E)-4-hydroxy-3-methylbut-2-enyl-diphosphate synthase